MRAPASCTHSVPADDIYHHSLTLDHYLEGQKPVEEFSTHGLAKELRLSYSLLFRDSRRGRERYRSKERARAAIEGSVDPLLDELCGYDVSESWFKSWSPARETYHADTYFPIFRHRLCAIHNFMDGIEPNRLVSIWQDRRDLRLWVTIWVVLILTAVGILLAIVSLALSAAQLRVAEDGLDLQRESPNG